MKQNREIAVTQVDFRSAGRSVPGIPHDDIEQRGPSQPARRRMTKQLRPDIGLLFMSGHALPAFEAELSLVNEFRLVEKPFDQVTLLTNIRKVFDYEE